MARNVVVIDYGMGNLHSVAKALVRAGASVQVTRDTEVVSRAECLVVPGVGAFGEAMKQLRTLDLVEPIRGHIRSGQPFLGICLGFQILFDVGYEDGEHPGLGVFRGKVVRFGDLAPDGSRLKVPHIGWNQIEIVRRQRCFDGIADGTYVYFVHSYYPAPEDPSIVVAWTDYAGKFASAIAVDNLFAVQFHPEKSQRVGLRMLENFLRV